jgi:restriction endonuclease XhoI-like protein
MDQSTFEAAIRRYWVVRERQASKQLASGRLDAGQRGAVTGGAHMDAMAELMASIFIHAGFDPLGIRLKSRIELPGYFRPEKRWDLIVIHEGALAAAIEFKSQVGPSFGNNYNNRCEEAVGSALDIRTAHREGLIYAPRLWLGYLFLLEECPDSTRPIRVREPVFAVDDEFSEASYKERYETLCRRLVAEGLYDAACFATTSPEPQSPIDEPAHDLTFDSFSRAIRAHAKMLLAAG